MTHEQRGAATVSVDWNMNADRGSSAPRGEEAMLTRLLELLDRYEIPTTWFLPEPAESAAVAKILHADVPHEIALLGDEAWVGQSAGRRSFAIELSRRLSAARDAGLTVHALAISGSRIPRDHYDLLIKHDIRVVRQPESGAGRGAGPVMPQSLRHGVWEVPPSAVLPRRGAWWGRGIRAARSAIRRIVAGAGVAHIVLDAGGLATDDPRLHSVENILRLISRRRGGGAIDAATLTPLAEELGRPAASVPTRSILRAA